MPAEIVKKIARAGHRDIYVTVMDDYGAELHRALPVTLTAAERLAKINSDIALMNAGQQQLETAAAEEGLDLAAAKTAGVAAKAAARKKSGMVG
jgi:hypothetical protein